MRKRCLHRGCPTLIDRGSYCVRHLPYRGDWNYLSATILRRDYYRCKIQGPICTGTATTVDHINGDPLDNRPENLRAACRSCNTVKGGLA